jgi:3-keto-L-gulonate-6-phosphate decarboxylase
MVDSGQKVLVMVVLTVVVDPGALDSGVGEVAGVLSCTAELVGVTGTTEPETVEELTPVLAQLSACS